MPYIDFFGSGLPLLAQLGTLAAIALAIVVWRTIYLRTGAWHHFLAIAFLPLILWIIFGTLDITITTRCAYPNPSCEGNLAARWFFEQFGFFGGPLVSVAWISLWASAILVLLYLTRRASPRTQNVAHLLVLAALYGLALGHGSALLGWFVQTQSLHDTLSRWLPSLVHRFLLVLIVSSLHLTLVNYLKLKTRKTIRQR